MCFVIGKGPAAHLRPLIGRSGAESRHVGGQRVHVLGGAHKAAARLGHRGRALAVHAGKQGLCSRHVAGDLGGHRHAKVLAGGKAGHQPVGQRRVGGDLFRAHAGPEFHCVAGVQFLGQGFQRVGAHAVAHQHKAQRLCARRPGLHRRFDDGLKALGGAEVAGEYQIEPPGKAGGQGFVVDGHGVKIFAVLGNDRHRRFRLFCPLAKAAAQALAHGDELVAPAVMPVAHPVGDAPQEAVLHRQHAVKIFRPDVQHIAGQRDLVEFGIHNGGQVHQHRAGVVAQHRRVRPFQPPETEHSAHRPADIVEEDARAGVALAADLPRPDDVHPVVFFTPGAGVAVAGKPLPLGVVGQAAEHVHLPAPLDEAGGQVVHPKGLRPEVLGDDEQLFSFHVSSCARPSCSPRPRSSG